jgi:hypothetical protein
MIGLKQMPIPEHSRPQVRNHKKRESLAKRDYRTIFDQAISADRTYEVGTPLI